MFETKFKVGDIAYSFFFDTNFIVPVKILEVSISFSVNGKCYWYHKFEDYEYIIYSSKEYVTFENTWGFKEISDKNEIEFLISQCTNQGYPFYGLDEPVGHSVSNEDLFKTLQDAINIASPINKRSRKRKNKKVISLRTKIYTSLNQQHVNVGREIKNLKEKLEVLNKKPVYCRKR